VKTTHTIFFKKPLQKYLAQTHLTAESFKINIPRGYTIQGYRKGIQSTAFPPMQIHERGSTFYGSCKNKLPFLSKGYIKRQGFKIVCSASKYKTLSGTPLPWVCNMKRNVECNNIVKTLEK